MREIITADTVRRGRRSGHRIGRRHRHRTGSPTEILRTSAMNHGVKADWQQNLTFSHEPHGHRS